MSSFLFDSIRQKLRKILSARKYSEIATRFDMSDVVQESSIQIWQHVNDHDLTESQVDTRWLRSVAKGHYCKLMRFHLAAKRNVNAEATVADLSRQPDSMQAANHASQQDAKVLDLMEGIDLLDPLSKQIVIARFFEEQTFPQIAKNFGVPIHRARKLLADSLAFLQTRI